MRRALPDLDVGVRAHLHARQRPHRRRHELVAGDPHHPARESHRADPDGAQRSRRHEVRHSVPGPGAHRFGVGGANVPAVLRALVACGWFGIQAWIGGQAIYSMLKIFWPPAAVFAGGVWIYFFAFWGLSMWVVWRGIDTIKFLEGVGAPFLLGIGLLLLLWITEAGRRPRPGARTPR